MSRTERATQRHPTDTAPGDDSTDAESPGHGIGVYVIGLGLATFLTCVSFFMSGTDLVWVPSIPVALCVLAVAQMGVHLVFFLHITSGPDNTNNIMALAFGVLIVMLVIGGSLFIMDHMNHNMPQMSQIMQMQR